MCLLFNLFHKLPDRASLELQYSLYWKDFIGEEESSICLMSWRTYQQRNQAMRNLRYEPLPAGRDSWFRGTS